MVCGTVTLEVWFSGVADAGGWTPRTTAGEGNFELLVEAREATLWALFVIEACTRRTRGGFAAEGTNPNKLVEGGSAVNVRSRVVW
jgi:hypothetical protein